MTEHKVVFAGGRTVVEVAAGRGDDLQRHLADSGIDATVEASSDTGRDRLVFAPDADPRAVQPVVDRWPG
jgi:hypothetical protein